MSSRNVRGMLTAEALASGLKEQYAVLRRRGKVVVELAAITGGLGFEVTVSVTSGPDSTLKASTFDRLNEARAEFLRLVRRNP